MISRCKHNKLVLRLCSLQQLSIRKALQLKDLLHKIMGIEIVSVQLISSSAVLVEAAPTTVKLILVGMSTAIKFRDTKSTCNSWPFTLIAFSPGESIIFPLELYIRRSLNLIPHHSHIHQCFLEGIRTSVVVPAIWLLRAQWTLCFSWLLFSFSHRFY